MKKRLFDTPKIIQEHPIVKEMPDRARGVQRKYEFSNGYGASVVRFGWKWLTTDLFNYGSYTSNENEWELAVLKGDNLCSDTPITNDVMGHLTEIEVEKVLQKIKSLPKV